MKYENIKDSSKLQGTKTFSNISQGLVLGPDDGEKLVRRWGHPFLIKVDELNGDSKQFTVGSEKLLPGKSIHVHRHDDIEELLIITAGEGRLLLGDKYIAVEAGSLVFIPQQVWHGLDNTGTETIDFLWIFPKLGMEQYFRDTSVSAEASLSPISEEELSCIRIKHREKVEYRDETLKNYTTQKTVP